MWCFVVLLFVALLCCCLLLCFSCDVLEHVWLNGVMNVTSQQHQHKHLLWNNVHGTVLHGGPVFKASPVLLFQCIGPAFFLIALLRKTNSM